MADEPKTNISDMLAVHGAFRTTLPGAARLVAAVDEGDTDRAILLANFYENILDFLHAHHSGEDEIIWPRLLERCPDEAGEVRRIADQHDDVTEFTARARAELSSWSGSASASLGAELVATLDALDGSLQPHFAEEEAVILPLRATYMSPDEWAELPAHGFSHFAGDKPWLILGLILDQLPEEPRQQMLAHMPPPAQEMWAGFGHAAYVGLMADVHGRDQG
jgi:hypothetical protein